MFRDLDAQRAKRTLLLREQGVASSNLVIPTSIYKERPSWGRSFFLYFSLFAVHKVLLTRS